MLPNHQAHSPFVLKHTTSTRDRQRRPTYVIMQANNTRELALNCGVNLERNAEMASNQNQHKKNGQ